MKQKYSVISYKPEFADLASRSLIRTPNAIIVGRVTFRVVRLLILERVRACLEVVQASQHSLHLVSVAPSDVLSLLGVINQVIQLYQTHLLCCRTQYGFTP